MGLILSLLPLYVTQGLGLSLSTAGLAISAHYFVDTLLRTPSGWLADRVGVRRVLVAGSLVTLAALLILWHRPAPLGLVAAAALWGLGTAALWPSVVTGATSLAPPESRSSVMGMVFSAWLVGAGLGPVVVNFLINRSFVDAFAALLACIGLSVLTAATVVRVPSPGTTPAETGRPPVLALASRVWPLFPGMFAQTMALGVLVPVVSRFIQEVLGFSHTWYAILLLGGGALTVVLLVPMGRLADRLGSRTLLVVGFAIAGLALLFLSKARSFPAVMFLAAVLGVSYAVILPAWNGYLARVVPKDQEASSWGLFMTIEGMGMAAGPAIGAFLWSQVGPLAPFDLSAGILLTMSVFYVVYRGRLVSPAGS